MSTRRRFLTRVAMAMGAAHVGGFGTAESQGASRELTAIGRAGEWLNSPRLTPERLAGKAVLVQFWTYTCINWLRTLPYVRAWAQKYGQQLIVIGVHTPEFAFEQNVDNVRRAVQQMRIEYPVVLDNNYPQGIEVAADWDNLKSPESYVGYDRAQDFASRPASRHGPPRRESPIRVRVSIDGQPPGVAHGVDVEEGGNGTVVEQRVYHLVRQPKPIVDRTFEIEFLDAGVEVFAFTFG